MIDFLNQGWVGIVIGSLFSLASLYYGFRRAAPKATIEASHELTWGSSPKLPSGFELTFRGQKIPTISRGISRIWNSGNETLGGELVPAHDQLRIEIPDGEFLLVATLKETNPVNKFTIKIDPKNPKVAFLAFDFLDPTDGVVVAFLHSSMQAVPKIKGTIKGHKLKLVAEIVRNKKKKVPQLIQKLRRFFPIFAILVGLTFTIFSLLPQETVLSFEDFVKSTARPIKKDVFAVTQNIAYGVVGISYMALGGLALWKRKKKHPKNLDWQKVYD
jgi:LPXTG-motif cell wall-anchored protein